MPAICSDNIVAVRRQRLIKNWDEPDLRRGCLLVVGCINNGQNLVLWEG